MLDEKDTDIVDRLSEEFAANARDQLDDIDLKLDQYLNDEVNAETVLGFVQREIHNIKGQGSTFGFPLTGRVAHMLEDYLLNTDGISEDNISNIRVYLEMMTNFVLLGEPSESDDPQEMLNTLPTGHVESFSTQKERIINVLLVMPAGMQRKMVSKELLSCGFRVSRAYDSTEALSVALDLIPEIVFINFDMLPFNGRELSNVFAAVDKLRNTHIVLLTSYAPGDKHLHNLPDSVAVIKKQKNFMESISELLIKWDVFGKTTG